MSNSKEITVQDIIGMLNTRYYLLCATKGEDEARKTIAREVTELITLALPVLAEITKEKKK